MQLFPSFQQFTAKELDVQTYSTRDVIYKEHDRQTYLYIIEQGQVELSTYVSQELNPSIKDLMEQELMAINLQYGMTLQSKNINAFKQRVQIAILGENQHFGELEFIEKKRRIMKAVCLSPDTIILRLNLTKVDFMERRNKTLLYELKASYSFKRNQMDDRITACIRMYTKQQAEIAMAEKRKYQDIMQGNALQQRKRTKSHQTQSNFYSPNSNNSQPDNFEDQEESKKINFHEYAQFQPTLHPNNYNLSHLGQAKNRIFKRVCKPGFTMNYNLMDQLSDTKKLGRYMNFIGASSKVAKFIKELSTSVKHSFVSSTDHKTEQKKTKSIKLQQKVKHTLSLITEINRQQLLFSDRDRNDRDPYNYEIPNNYEDHIDSKLRYTTQLQETSNNLRQLKTKVTTLLNKPHFLMEQLNTERQESIDQKFDYDELKNKYHMSRIHSKETSRYFPGGPKLPTQSKKYRSQQRTPENLGRPFAVPLIPRIKQL